MPGKVSIVVPVYNSAEHLRGALLSIIDQAYQDLEIILVNDGSTDDSLQICRDFAEGDARIMVLNQMNAGVSSARNLGIDNATGAYLTFMDSDDYLYPNAISRMVVEIEESGVEVLRTTCEMMDSQKSWTEKTIEPRTYLKDELKIVIEAVATGRMSAYSPLLMIKRESLPVELRFDTQFSLMEDACFYVDLFQSVDSLRVSPTVTYRYILRDSSASRANSHFFRNADNIFQINRRFNHRLKKEGYLPAVNATHARILANYAFILFNQSKDKKEYRRFYRYLKDLDYARLVARSDLKFLPLHNAMIVSSLRRNHILAAAILRFFSILRLLMKRRK